LCPALRGRQQFLPRNGQRVKDGLHRCFSIAPSSLMRARFVVLLHPGIEIPLQLVDGAVDFLAERDAIELVEHGAMEAFADSIGLRVLGAGVIDVLDGESEAGRKRILAIYDPDQQGDSVMWAIILNSVYRQFLRSSLSGMRKFAAG
jgi:hypothetical protein